MRKFRAPLRLATVTFQMFFMAVFVGVGLTLFIYSVACALGYAPWLQFPLTFGDAAPVEAGWIIQCAVTALVLGMAVYLPANHRILALETSHRRFSINMRDVARAYEAVHQADRVGVFQMKSEFDSVRERMIFMRNHPDLADIENDILEVAAQMGSVSHELAEIYSDERVDRARTFLKQRQEEIEMLEERLEEAKIVANDIHSWARRVEIDEDVARSEIARLRELLYEVLPELDGDVHNDDPTPPKPRPKPGVIHGLPSRQAAE